MPPEIFCLFNDSVFGFLAAVKWNFAATSSRAKLVVKFPVNLFTRVNPKKKLGGRNLPAATLKACRVVRDEAGGIKPSCNFHFRCLKQVDDINLGGCLGKFSKNLSYEKKNPNETEKFFFEKSIFCNFFKTNCIFLCQICI